MKIIVFSFVALYVGCSSAPTNNYVDPYAGMPAIEKAIRKQLGKPTGELVQGDINRLGETFGVDNTRVTDLAILSRASSVQTLFLYNDQLTDISPLAGCSGLQFLNLQGNQITDLKPLHELPHLLFVDLRNNPVSREEIKKLKKARPSCIIIHRLADC